MHMVETQVRRINSHGDKRYAHGSMSSNLTIIDNTIISMNCPSIHRILMKFSKDNDYKKIL